MEIAAVHNVTVRQCVILLENPDAPGIPRSLMPCGDRPFLAWLMREMQRFGVEEFVFLTEQASPDVLSAIENLGSFLPKSARTVISVTPCGMGTGEGLRHARRYLRERFLLCPANTLFSCNLARFLTAARSGHWMLLRPAQGSDQEAAICLHEEGLVSFLRDGERIGQARLASSGICLFDVTIFEVLTQTCSLERDILPKLAENGNLHGFSLPGDFYDVASARDLKNAEKMSRPLRRPAVFLDRDGVINRDFGWVGTRERFEWEPKVRETIARMTDSGHHVFIVTNQSGIARGFYSENDLQVLMGWVIESIREYGGTIDDWRYCPMHPEAAVEQYRGQSVDRKPGPGMILDLLRRWELDPARCVLFGDQPTDMQAAEAAGLGGIMVGADSLFDLVSVSNSLSCKQGISESSRHDVRR